VIQHLVRDVKKIIIESVPKIKDWIMKA